MKYLNIEPHLDMSFAFLNMDYAYPDAKDYTFKVAKGIIFYIGASHYTDQLRKALLDPNYFAVPDVTLEQADDLVQEAFQMYLAEILTYTITSFKCSNTQYNLIMLMLHQFGETNQYNLFSFKQFLNRMKIEHREYLISLVVGESSDLSMHAQDLIAEIQQVAKANSLNLRLSKRIFRSMIHIEEDLSSPLVHSVKLIASRLFTLPEYDMDEGETEDDVKLLPITTGYYKASLEEWSYEVEDFNLARNIYYDVISRKGYQGLGQYFNQESIHNMLLCLLYTDLRNRYPDYDFRFLRANTEFSFARELSKLNYSMVAKKLIKEFGPALAKWIDEPPKQSFVQKVKLTTLSLLDA